jgi:hypothetical protein
VRHAIVSALAVALLGVSLSAARQWLFVHREK